MKGTSSEHYGGMVRYTVGDIWVPVGLRLLLKAPNGRSSDLPETRLDGWPSG